VNAGSCTTTGFPLEPDAYSSLGVASAGIARREDKNNVYAQTALFGFPDSMTFLLYGIMIFTRVPSVQFGPPSGSVSVNFGMMFYPVLSYNADYGSILAYNPVTDIYYYLEITPRILTLQYPIIAIPTGRLGTIPPPNTARGFRILNYDNNQPFTADTSSFTWSFTILNDDTALLTGYPIGTVLYVVERSASPGPNIYVIVQTVPQPNDNIGLKYLSQQTTAVNTALYNPSSSSTQTFWTNMLIFGTTGSCNNPNKYFFITSAQFFLPNGGIAFTVLPLLTQCQEKFSDYCNGGVPLQYDYTAQSFQVILTYTNGGVPTVPPGFVGFTSPVQGPLFITMTLAPGLSGVMLTLQYGLGPGGGPGPTQSGFRFVQVGSSQPSFYYNTIISVTITPEQASLLGNRVTATLPYCLNGGGPCESANLFQYSSPSQCLSFLVAPMNDPSLQIADCNTCTNCLCKNQFAERGTGNLCCPTGRLGLNCTVPVPGCVDLAEGIVCSGNGNATYPNNINQTGCYKNPTTNSFTCACLPEFAPPLCDVLFTDVCGTPLCNNHGNCSFIPSTTTYVCSCQDGYEGIHCQYPIPQCFDRLGDIACSGHGFCNDPDPDQIAAGLASGFGSPVCVCDPGWSGVLCQQSLTTPCLEDVTDSICSDRGVCGFSRACNLPFPAVRFSEPCTNCSIYLSDFTQYVLLSGNDIFNMGNNSFFEGDVATLAGKLVTNLVAGGNVHGQIVTISSGVLTDFTNQVNDLRVMTCTNTSARPFLGGTYGPGVYCFDDNPIDVSTIAPIALHGTADDVFIFLFPNAFTIQPQSVIECSIDVIPNNVFFIAGNDMSIGAGSEITGWFIAVGRIRANTSLEFTGHLATITKSIFVTNVEGLVPVAPFLEAPCTTLPSEIDICNFTAPGNASTLFCNQRLPLNKKLLTTDIEFETQVFSLAELKCLVTNFTQLRGFGVMNWQTTYCMRTVQSFQVFFTSAGGLSGILPCPEEPPTQNFNNFIRMFFWASARPYLFSEQCYLAASLIQSTDPLAPSGPAMYEAIYDRQRVGLTTSIGLDPREALFQACQAFALNQKAPFYGIDVSFSLCWLPSVPNINSPAKDLNAFANFVYNTDISDPDAYQFWVAPTSSIIV